jgi:hypothetical protein
MGIRSLKSASISTGTKSSKFWDQSTVLSSYESIATVNVGSGGVSSVSFSSIPSTYKHLQIRGIVRSDRVNSVEGFNYQLNGVSSSSYYYHRLYGDGSAAAADNAGGLGTGNSTGQIPASTATANVFGVMVMDILDYQNTNKYKTTRSLLGFDSNGSGTIWFASGLYSANTNAISSISFYGSSTSNISQYSSFALYGIKG